MIPHNRQHDFVADKEDNSFKKEWENDIYWKYYDSNLKARTKVNMEDVDVLDHRFDSWRVSQRKS